MFINRQFCRVTQTREHRDLRQSVFFYYSKKKPDSREKQKALKTLCTDGKYDTGRLHIGIATHLWVQILFQTNKIRVKQEDFLYIEINMKNKY